MERLDEIRERLSKITDRPWALVPEQCGPGGQAIVELDSGGPIVEVGDPYPRGNNRPQENMEFFLHAADDIEYLLEMFTEAGTKRTIPPRLCLSKLGYCCSVCQVHVMPHQKCILR